MRIAISTARHGVLLALAAAALFPLYFILTNSLKDTTQFITNPWLPPAQPIWSNYAGAWAQVGDPIVHSCVVVLASVAGILLLASLSAYAFGVLSFPGRNALFALVFSLLLVPSFLTLIPLYLQINRVGLGNNYLGLILPYIAGGQAFSVFVLKSAFEGISGELLEAARIDGAGNLRIYRSIVIPLTVPVLISVGIVNVVSMWNDLLLPQLVLDGAHATLTMALVSFEGSAQTHFSPDFGALLAAYAIAATPLLVLFGFLMRHYVAGLTSGALKL